MRTVLPVLLLAIVIATPCPAARPEVWAEGSQVAQRDRHPGHDVTWSQQPVDTGNASAAQLAPDYFYAESATDFVAWGTMEIAHVRWWGTTGFWKRSEPITTCRAFTPAAHPSWPLDCTGAIVASCGVDSLDGTTVGAPADVNGYGGCTWQETGPEVVYELWVPFAGTIMTAHLSNLTADLDLFLLGSCDETDCLTFGDYAITHTFADAGTYYLVVDGYWGAAGAYKLTIGCPDVPPIYFNLRFYADNPLRPAEPGELLYEYSVLDCHKRWEGALNCYSYWADIALLPVTEGERYWFSVQSVMNWHDYGQWFWTHSLPVVEGYPVMDFAEVDVPRWTSFPDVDPYHEADLAFELSAIESPVERTNWGIIKGMYR